MDQTKKKRDEVFGNTGKKKKKHRRKRSTKDITLPDHQRKYEYIIVYFGQPKVEPCPEATHYTVRATPNSSRWGDIFRQYAVQSQPYLGRVLTDKIRYNPTHYTAVYYLQPYSDKIWKQRYLKTSVSYLRRLLVQVAHALHQRMHGKKNTKNKKRATTHVKVVCKPNQTSSNNIWMRASQKEYRYMTFSSADRNRLKR